MIVLFMPFERRFVAMYEIECLTDDVFEKVFVQCSPEDDSNDCYPYGDCNPVDCKPEDLP